MKPTERAALKLMIKRYTAAKTTSKAIALATLVKQGTHTQSGEITAEYGGEKRKKSKKAAAGL